MKFADIMARADGGDDVVVELAEHGIGPTPAMHVMDAHKGIDWDTGRLILVPAEELVSWDYIEWYMPGTRAALEEEVARRQAEALEGIMGKK